MIVLHGLKELFNHMIFPPAAIFLPRPDMLANISQQDINTFPLEVAKKHFDKIVAQAITICRIVKRDNPGFMECSEQGIDDPTSEIVVIGGRIPVGRHRYDCRLFMVGDDMIFAGDIVQTLKSETDTFIVRLYYEVQENALARPPRGSHRIRQGVSQA